jgi:hypothetical protein
MTTKTYPECAAWRNAQVGKSGLPQEWTPASWDNSYNDCAVFQSYCLFDDLRYYVVSQFANNMPHTNGNVGDLACYSWDTGNDYDHIGTVISVPDGNGDFYSLEANTSGPISGHQVAIKVRNRSSVVCFVDPQYAAPQPPEDELSQAEVQQILTAIRRDARGRLYYDAGDHGQYTADNSPRAVVAKVTDGFIYPLAEDANVRTGQVNSLRATPYLLIDKDEQFVGLLTEQFENMVEMCNGHLRRIAQAVLNAPVVPATTDIAVPTEINPTPVLKGY